MMKWSIKSMALLGALGVGGCYYSPPPRHVVEREVVDPNGRVVERDEYVVEEPPPPERVEVIPVRPYYGAIWVRGHYVHGRHRGEWIWVPGHWR